MSQNNRIKKTGPSLPKKKKLRLDARFWARVMVVLLALSMLAGTFYYLIVFTSASVVTAADTDESNPTMRIAVIYDDNVKDDAMVTAENGFSLGVLSSDGRTYTEKWESDATLLHIARHGNLAYSSNRYVRTTDASQAKVGGYHIRIVSSEATFAADYAAIVATLSSYHVFAAWFDGVPSVMIGQYTTKSAAETAKTQVLSTLASSSLTASQKAAAQAAVITEPTTNAVCAIDPAAHHIEVLLVQSSGTLRFAAKARQGDSSTTTYIKLYHNTLYRSYDDVLEFSPYVTENYDGVKAVSVIAMETYITGVIASEISTSWPMETLKAFAIAVRCYTHTHSSSHSSSYDADLCNTSHCQVFNGIGHTNDRVRRAVSETHGIVAVYNGKICQSYYSSSTGGCTANVSDIWGSNQASYPYLTAVATPWERYASYGRGTITTYVTGEQLYQRLEAKGYTALTGAVTDVKITAFGANSSYVYSIKFTDAAGNSVEVKQGNKVLSLLGVYLYSDNFVVCKAGETVTRTNFTKLGFNAEGVGEPQGIVIQGHPTVETISGSQTFDVLTADGIVTMTPSNAETVMTADGLVELAMGELLDTGYFPTITGVYGDLLPDLLNIESVAVTETIETEAAENTFVFIGRGWGHGVGMSQYGIYDLGNLGYDYETIFKAYYTGVTLMTYGEYKNL